MYINSYGKISSFDISQHRCSSYLRIDVKDLPGVLSSITKIFSQNKISIKNLIQKPNKKNKYLRNLIKIMRSKYLILNY